MSSRLSLNKYLLLILLAAVALGVLLWSEYRPETPTQTPPSRVIISMEPGSFKPGSDLGFSPKTVVVVIGVNNTVLWRNDDSDVHSAHSNIPEFDSGLLQPGMTYTHTFLRPGKFPYHCDPHPWMTGMIVVKER